MNLDSDTTERRTADTEMKLATGGPLGSTQMNLWRITATATDEDTGLPIPPEQLQIGNLGTLDTNGELWVLLADNDPTTITSKPLKPIPHYKFKVGANYYPLSIAANQTRLFEKVVVHGADFCVGQAIYFNVVGFPCPTTNVIVAQWHLPDPTGRAFVNRQPSNNCLAYYDKDSSLLSVTNANPDNLTTYAWYVNESLQSYVTVALTFKILDKTFTNNVQGLFNVHRPTTATGTPYQPDGTPKAQIIPTTPYWILSLFPSLNPYSPWALSLGVTGVTNDMSFQHQITTDIFSAGQAGYVQLITSADFETEPTLNAPTNTVLDAALGEFPRSTSAIPANTTTNVWFWDAPALPLSKNIATTTEDVSFSTYLMFMPSAGPGPNIFVPLRLITWEVHDEAQPDVSSTNGWKAINSTGKGTPQITRDDDKNIGFPSWTTTYP